MSVHSKRRKWILVSLFALLILCMGMSASAATTGWKKNSNGTYSYYKDGKKQKNKWIEGSYYVDAKGVRKTGWLYKSKKWYYLSRTGRVVKNSWIKSGSRKYYATANGSLYLNGRHKVGDYYYAFSKRGEKLVGRRTYAKKTYYFGKQTGRMLVNQWVTENKKQYFYGKDGALVKSQWIGRYYVGNNGARVKSTWKGDRYLTSSGKAAVGLTKVGSYLYYFNPETYRKVVSTAVVIDGITYEFNSKGHGARSKKDQPPKTSVSVEKTYYSDKYVSDAELLAAIIYCEAGNQTYEGKLGVGLVIMNRVHSPLCPSKLREVVYQKQQFTPARDGSLTRTLKDPARIDEDCRKAAAEVMQRMKEYKKGDKVTMVINKKEVDFSYLFFMTPAAYKRLGLSAPYRKLGDHVFFKKWA